MKFVELHELERNEYTSSWYYQKRKKDKEKKKCKKQKHNTKGSIEVFLEKTIVGSNQERPGIKADNYSPALKMVGTH